MRSHAREPWAKGWGRILDTSLAREADQIFRRAAFRLVPLVVAMYVASFLNRVNVGFAALTMNRDLGFTPEIYGFGAGVFFFGYFLFELPSNLILEKVGARLWLSRIMISWAIVSMATAFVHSALSFYMARFLLGIAEAGFYPGILLYFTYWFPAAVRARIMAVFTAGISISNVMGAPLSGWLLSVHAAHLEGWQWLYLIEGLPTLALGLVVFWALPDNPATASWLSAREKDIVLATLSQEERPRLYGFAEMIRDWRVWALIVPDFCIIFGIYALGFWLPQMVKAMGFSNLATGMIVMIPYLVALFIVWAIAVFSDRSGRRVFHFVLSAFLAALGFAIAAMSKNDAVVICGFCLASGGVYSGLATFWTIPPHLLGGTAAAGAFAMINSFGNLSGFAGPAMMGWLREVTGDYQAGLWVCVIVPLIAGLAMTLTARSFMGGARTLR